MQETIDAIIETNRLREDMLRARNRLILQAKAMCRRLVGGDKKEADKLYRAVDAGTATEVPANVHVALASLLDARDSLDKLRKGYEKTMTKAVKELDAFAWWEDRRGLGALGLAQVVGEAGDLHNYSCPSKLWKRMGLACIDGERQRKVKDKEKAEMMGYCPRRRSTMYVIGDSMIRAKGEYYELYIDRKRYELEKQPDITPGHAHNRAKRYMEKRILRDLWNAWNGVVLEMAEAA